MKMFKRKKHNQVLGDRRGVASIEFAFISSVLAFTLMAVSDVGILVFQRNNMVSSLKSGIDYFMKGGTKHEEAVAVIKASWHSIPEQTTVSVSTFCTCGYSVAVCYATCHDESVPITYNKITIETFYDGLLFDRTYVIDEALRIR